MVVQLCKLRAKSDTFVGRAYSIIPFYIACFSNTQRINNKKEQRGTTHFFLYFFSIICCEQPEDNRKGDLKFATWISNI